MLDQTTIEQLASLARIKISDEEKVRLQKDLEAILGYVSELNEVAVSEEQSAIGNALVRNVVRLDEARPQTSETREALLDGSPSRVGDHVAVKAVLAGK